MVGSLNMFANKCHKERECKGEREREKRIFFRMYRNRKSTWLVCLVRNYINARMYCIAARVEFSKKDCDATIIRRDNSFLRCRFCRCHVLTWDVTINNFLAKRQQYRIALSQIIYHDKIAKIYLCGFGGLIVCPQYFLYADKKNVQRSNRTVFVKVLSL